MKGSRDESIDEARKEYKKLLYEGLKRLLDLIFLFLKNWWIGNLLKI